MAQIILVMGVSGSGKSTIAKALAAELGFDFLDADSFHDAASIAKMTAGEPLTDADRAPWLERIHAALIETSAAGRSAVLACSALRKTYRQTLFATLPHTKLIYLEGTKSLLAQRIAARKGHFMPASLLDSQLATLEKPEADEHPTVIPIDGSPEQTVALIRAALSANSPR